MTESKIIYTHTDEAPALATYSLLPIVEAFAGAAGVDRRNRETSRWPAASLAQFPDFLDRGSAGQRRPGRARCDSPRRLRRTSSSCPTSRRRCRSSKAAIAELQAKGYALPDYPDDPIDTGTARHQGPLRPGRRARRSTRCSAKATPIVAPRRPSRSTPGTTRTRWVPGRPTRRPTSPRWAHDDFFSNEQSVTMADRRRPAHRARRRRRHGHRAQGLGTGAGRRGRRRHVHVEARTRRVPRRADRRRQGAGRAVLAPPQGDDDEGLRPDHLRSRRRGLLRAGLRTGTATCSKRPAPNPNNGWARRARRDRRRCPPSSRPTINEAIDAHLDRPPRHRDGRLRPRHHQPARAERHHRRRLDAGDDPHVRADVEQARRAAGLQGRDPRLQLRRRVPGRDRRLPGQRCVRPGHDGFGAQRRADGPEGRGVRQPRQDVRDPGRRHRSGRRPRPASRSWSFDVRGRRHLADVQRPRPPDPGLGQAGRHPGAGHRRSRRVLARRRPCPRRPADREGQPVPRRPRHRRSRDPDHVAGRGHASSRSSASARASTRSRSPATCCATTTPICSRSSRSAPAPRCSRSCR